MNNISKLCTIPRRTHLAPSGFSAFLYNTLEWTIAKKAKYKYLQCSSNIEKNYYIWHLIDQSVVHSSLHNKKRKNEKSLELNSQWFPFLVNIWGGSWIGCAILFSQDGLIKLASFIFLFLLTSTSSWSIGWFPISNLKSTCVKSKLTWNQILPGTFWLLRGY